LSHAENPISAAHTNGEAIMTQIARIIVGLGLALAAIATDATAQGYRGGCRGSGLSCQELRYYCGFGDQIPKTVRPYCGGDYESRGGGYESRGGGYEPRRGGYERDYDDYRRRGPEYGGGERRRAYGDGCRGSGLSCQELRYWCGFGDQIPKTVRPYC
jgi:hypothetical protein